MPGDRCVRAFGTIDPDRPQRSPATAPWGRRFLHGNSSSAATGCAHRAHRERHRDGVNRCANATAPSARILRRFRRGRASPIRSKWQFSSRIRERTGRGRRGAPPPMPHGGRSRGVRLRPAFARVAGATATPRVAGRCPLIGCFCRLPASSEDRSLASGLPVSAGRSTGTRRGRFRPSRAIAAPPVRDRRGEFQVRSHRAARAGSLRPKGECTYRVAYARPAPHADRLTPLRSAPTAVDPCRYSRRTPSAGQSQYR